MTRKNWGVFLIATLGLSAPTGASTSDFGYVSQVIGMSNGAVLFNVEAPRTALPSCHYVAVPKRWALDARTPAGQAQVAILLNAHATRKRVTVAGSSACDVWGDTETASFFLVED